jgi:glycerol-1-phosphatase
VVTGPGLQASQAPLVQNYDVALLDLDGVVYVGHHVVPGAQDALSQARAAGMRLAFVTNNASRTPHEVAAQLAQLGIPAKPDEVVTSAQAAARLLAEQLPRGARVLLVGAEGLEHALVEQGLQPVLTADEHPAAVAQGYGPDVGWRNLAEAAYAIHDGAWWVATNTDPTLPTPRGPAPGNGALVAAVRSATGKDPVVAGKPELPMHREGILRTGATRPIVVGDRLDTDIEGARRGGVDSLLVLTGVTHPIDVVLAPATMRPTFIAGNLTGLLEQHPEVVVANGSATCRGWEARIDSGMRLTAANHVAESPIDALRAACGAVWAADEPPAPNDVQVALDQAEVPRVWLGD